MIKKLLMAAGLISGPYSNMTIKDGARMVYMEEERSRDPAFTDQTTIYDHNYNPGTLRPDGITEGKEGSEFEYLWRFYQGYKKSNPSVAPLTVMARWEREAINRGAH